MRAVLEQIVEGVEAAPAMIEHPVKHHAHVAGVCGGDETLKRGEITEVRVEPKIVEGIVFVVRSRLEDRVEVDRCRAEISEVVEMIDDPLQVAAHEVGE